MAAEWQGSDFLFLPNENQVSRESMDRSPQRKQGPSMPLLALRAPNLSVTAVSFFRFSDGPQRLDQTNRNTA
jgi:hypothetical protein